MDSQSIKATESGGISGYDAGKKIKGRKRHIVTGTLGLMVGLVAHSAGIQDRDGAPEALKSIRGAYPDLRHIFAPYGGMCHSPAGRWMVAMRDQSYETLLRVRETGQSRLLNAQTRRKVSRLSAEGRLLNAPSRG